MFMACGHRESEGRLTELPLPQPPSLETTLSHPTLGNFPKGNLAGNQGDQVTAVRIYLVPLNGALPHTAASFMLCV